MAYAVPTTQCAIVVSVLDECEGPDCDAEQSLIITISSWFLCIQHSHPTTAFSNPWSLPSGLFPWSSNGSGSEPVVVLCKRCKASWMTTSTRSFHFTAKAWSVNNAGQRILYVSTRSQQVGLIRKPAIAGNQLVVFLQLK